ncbi:MAG: hypothetical protein ACHQ9S_27660 [Candidatus Binatia bacterium]
MDARIDTGVREVVDALNQIPGVTTRASCEGLGRDHTHHRHADLAYVIFRHPLPLRLQEFLLTHIDSVGRIEGDGIYSRWPDRNRAFLDDLLVAARSYAGQQGAERRIGVRWPLPRLRSRLARQLFSGRPVSVQLCVSCGELVFDEHVPSHRPVPLLRCASDQAALWFVEFVAQPRNALDTDLIESDGWMNLIARTQRSEFGAAFQRRWLRYRAHMLADLATRQMRIGAENARRQRSDIDFFYNDTHAFFEWQQD